MRPGTGALRGSQNKGESQRGTETNLLNALPTAGPTRGRQEQASWPRSKSFSLKRGLLRKGDKTSGKKGKRFRKQDQENSGCVGKNRTTERAQRSPKHLRGKGWKRANSKDEKFREGPTLGPETRNEKNRKKEKQCMPIRIIEGCTQVRIKGDSITNVKRS